MRHHPKAGLAARILFFTGCLFSVLQISPAQDSDSSNHPVSLNSSIASMDEGLLDPAQIKISEAAKALVGRKNMNFEHARFTWDCSGTVMASLYNAGLDLRLEYSRGSGNGVMRLHQVIQSANLEYDPLLPETGDLIFFDNTYDKNGNKKWDDELTHVAVVLSVDNDGTIAYLHHDYRRGVVVAWMNLLVPDLQEVNLVDGSTKVLNSPLRMNKDRHLNPDRWLSSHLFRSFGRIRFYREGLKDFSDLALLKSGKNAQ